MMRKAVPIALLVVLLVYAAASLVHFVHNAEFLADYPNLPDSWSRAGVYFAWAGMTLVGALGWFLTTRGYQMTGLLVIAVYAAAGLYSLGHYVVAPMSAHTLAMNSTILLEVTAAAAVFVMAVSLIVLRSRRRSGGQP